MSKIISKYMWVAALLVGCSAKEEKVNQDVVIAPVTAVVGIGKVLPEGGMVTLSMEQTQRVVTVLKALGDTVKQGEVLFKTDAVQEEISVEQSKAALASASQAVQTTAYEVNLAETKLEALKHEFELSKRLFLQKAETAQKVFQDSVAYAEQLATLERTKQNVKAQKVALKERQLAIKANQQSVKERAYVALQDGILVDFNVTPGSVLSANSVFGELAPLKEIVVEGELDELHANKIKLGQQVSIALVGQSEPIGKGVVSFTGASLQNKSILYETVGEGTDRRVRRFRVRLTEGANNLLINQKVECKIQL